MIIVKHVIRVYIGYCLNFSFHVNDVGSAHLHSPMGYGHNSLKKTTPRKKGYIRVNVGFMGEVRFWTFSQMNSGGRGHFFPEI